MNNNVSGCNFNHFSMLWKAAHAGKVEMLLADEIKHYHTFCKNPDTGIRFRQFYSQIEPLHVYIASTSQVSANKFLNHQTILCEHSCSLFIVLKGTINLAHGDVLKAQLGTLSKSRKTNILLLLVDYDPSSASVLSEELGVRCVGCKIMNFSLKYYYFVILAALKQSTSSSIRIIWWGIEE